MAWARGRGLAVGGEGRAGAARAGSRSRSRHRLVKGGAGGGPWWQVLLLRCPALSPNICTHTYTHTHIHTQDAGGRTPLMVLVGAGRVAEALQLMERPGVGLDEQVSGYVCVWGGLLCWGRAGVWGGRASGWAGGGLVCC